MVSTLFMLVFVGVVGLTFRLMETKLGQKVMNKINIF